MRVVIALAVTAFLSVAVAVTLPPDANMFVADDDGVIVGVGRSDAGETFVLDVIAAYQGFARLVIVTSGGDVVVHDVMVMDGVVLLEFVDLRVIARRSGFDEVAVEAIDVFDASHARPPAGLPGFQPGGAPDVGPARSPDTPAAQPVAPDLPSEPGPPASTPGLPDGPPAHGPGGAHGGGPDGADAPTADDEDADEDPDDDQPGPPGLDRRP